MDMALVGHGGGLRLAVNRCVLNDRYVGSDGLESGHLRLGGCGGYDRGGDGGRCELGSLNGRCGDYSRGELCCGGEVERLFGTATRNRAHGIHRSHRVRDWGDHCGW